MLSKCSRLYGSETRAWINACLLTCICVFSTTRLSRRARPEISQDPEGSWGLQHPGRGLPTARFWESAVLCGSVSGGKTSTAPAQFPLRNLGHLGSAGVPTVGLLSTLHFCVWSQCLIFFIFRYNLHSVKCRHPKCIAWWFFTCVYNHVTTPPIKL